MGANWQKIVSEGFRICIAIRCSSKVSQRKLPESSAQKSYRAGCSTLSMCLVPILTLPLVLRPCLCRRLCCWFRGLVLCWLSPVQVGMSFLSLGTGQWHLDVHTVDFSMIFHVGRNIFTMASLRNRVTHGSLSRTRL